jgi:hypothetical protein
MSLSNKKTTNDPLQKQPFLEFRIEGNNSILAKLDVNQKNYSAINSPNSNKIDIKPVSHGIKVKTLDGALVCLMGMKLNRILHWELFKERAFPNSPNRPISLLCHQQWTNLAQALASLPKSIEFFMIVGSQSPINQNNTKVSLSFWVIGRGNTFSAAQKSAQDSFRKFQQLFNSYLDFVQFELITSDFQGDINQIQTYLQTPNVVELRRQYQEITVSYSEVSSSEQKNLGFQIEDQKLPENNCTKQLKINHLSPWLKSEDSWEKLLYMYAENPHSGALIIHFQSFTEVQCAIKEEALVNLANAEKLLNTQNQTEAIWTGNTIISSQATIIRDLALQRLNFLKGNTLAARVFVASPQPILGETIALISGSIDNNSALASAGATETLFCGGVKTINSSAKEILSPLNKPSLDLLFAPSEISVILRTPMPCGEELPEITSVRSRTASMTGNSGHDCLLGINNHRQLSQKVGLDEQLRFRHTYIIGQTGTGKSTLLCQMIMQDINKGRGVAVLDPHGTLIDDILEYYPKERAEDLIIVDVTDTQYPIGFNILCIPESDSFQYKLKRDLLIDELFAYLDRTYDLKKTGGPIFESHFRSSMALLLGSKPQQFGIPNLMIFRALYTNSDLRSFLVAMEDDPVIIDFVEEAEKTGGEASLENLAPYITSKFNRFISDTALRNITCQSRILDIDEIVNQGKVLLFNLGKARFGAQAAGLLSSQMVSRICNATMRRGIGGTPFYLYADEFQLFADERFAEILAEARKFNLSVTMAHQYINQLPSTVLSAVLGNVGTIIALRVGAVDAQNLESLFVPTFGHRDLSSLSNYCAYVRSSGILGQTPFSLKLLPLSQEKNTTQATELRQMSRLKYGRDYREVEEEINETYQNYTRLLF